MIEAIYNLAINTYKLLVPIISRFSPKIKIREKNWKALLELEKPKIANAVNKKKIWVHSASMGEFEQAKPIIEKIKTYFPDYFVICSFFSPSGYENQKNYRYLDVALYMPIDERKNVEYFLDAIQPNMALFVRYEIWLNYLKELKKREIPTYLINATAPRSFFPRKKSFTKSFYKKSYSLFDKIFPIEDDKLFFIDLDIAPEIVPMHDTRFDRVYLRIQQTSGFFLKKEMFNDYFILVAGSIWKPDAELIITAVEQLHNKVPIKIIYVPHEPNSSNLNFLRERIPNHKFLSELITQKDSLELKEIIAKNDIIVDSVGYLLDLYSLADVAYVGGGFGAGIHSVIEPAGYFLPIICGGGINNSIEAQQMNREGVLEVVNNPNQLVDLILNLFNNRELHSNKKKKVEAYFTKRLGSTEQVFDKIFSPAKT